MPANRAKGVECPECGGRTQVVDSRKRTDAVYRRRDCVKCGHRITTLEQGLISSLQDKMKTWEQVAQLAEAKLSVLKEKKEKLQSGEEDE